MAKRSLAGWDLARITAHKWCASQHSAQRPANCSCSSSKRHFYFCEKFVYLNCCDWIFGTAPWMKLGRQQTRCCAGWCLRAKQNYHFISLQRTKSSAVLFKIPLKISKSLSQQPKIFWTSSAFSTLQRVCATKTSYSDVRKGTYTPHAYT